MKIHKTLVSPRYSFGDYHMKATGIGKDNLKAHGKVLTETKKNFQHYYSHFDNTKPSRKQVIKANNNFVEYLNKKYPGKFNTVELGVRELRKSGYGMLVFGGGVDGGVHTKENANFINNFDLKACKDKDIQKELGLQKMLIDKGIDITKPTLIISKFMKNVFGRALPKFYGYTNLHESIHLEQCLNNFGNYYPALSKNPDKALKELKVAKKLLDYTVKQGNKMKPDYSKIEKYDSLPGLFNRTLHYELGNAIAYNHAIEYVPIHKRPSASLAYNNLYGSAYRDVFEAVYLKDKLNK